MTTTKSAVLQPGRVTFLDGQQEMAMLEINTPWSRAEVYLHGAHVTGFQKTGEAPLLFMSQCSRFAEGQPIRGGVPVIFPWFGPREGLPQHGFARIREWMIKEVTSATDGSVSVRFQLPDCPEAGTLPVFLAEYTVTVSQTLKLELKVENRSADEPLTYEDCLHTYFEVAESAGISVVGLKGVSYLDKVTNFARKTESEEVIRINSEVDRTYLDTEGPVEIVDLGLGRRIRIEKRGSRSTVVWNPWIAKSQQMPDFGNEEYHKMVCVESGNVGDNQITLGPGQAHTTRVKISSEAVGS